jgi:hypothetical protein
LPRRAGSSPPHRRASDPGRQASATAGSSGEWRASIRHARKRWLRRGRLTWCPSLNRPRQPRNRCNSSNRSPKVLAAAKGVNHPLNRAMPRPSLARHPDRKRRCRHRHGAADQSRDGGVTSPPSRPRQHAERDQNSKQCIMRHSPLPLAGRSLAPCGQPPQHATSLHCLLLAAPVQRAARAGLLRCPSWPQTRHRTLQREIRALTVPA